VASSGEVLAGKLEVFGSGQTTVTFWRLCRGFALLDDLLELLPGDEKRTVFGDLLESGLEETLEILGSCVFADVLWMVDVKDSTLLAADLHLLSIDDLAVSLLECLADHTQPRRATTLQSLSSML